MTGHLISTLSNDPVDELIDNLHGNVAVDFWALLQNGHAKRVQVLGGRGELEASCGVGSRFSEAGFVGGDFHEGEGERHESFHDNVPLDQPGN